MPVPYPDLMLLALSDTHATESPQLTPHLREQIHDAEQVVHAGDFTTAAVLDGFESAASSFAAVSGNRDTATVRERLPETHTVTWADRRFLLVHGHRHDSTALSLLARQENADVAIIGHSHRPVIESIDGLTVVNPGSHADPRRFDAAYATFGRAGGGVRIRLRTPRGEALATDEI